MSEGLIQRGGEATGDNMITSVCTDLLHLSARVLNLPLLLLERRQSRTERLNSGEKS